MLQIPSKLIALKLDNNKNETFKEKNI